MAELTEAERETWCEWYSGIAAGGPGHAPKADRPVEGGYATGAACSFDYDFCGAALPRISVAQCMANLSLSECESPLSNLTGCVSDMFSRACTPFDYDCLDYLEAPNCAGSILLLATSVVDDCAVRVE